MLTIHVNGDKHQVDATPDTPLLWILRDNLNLTGTKFGCGIAQCGACTVHIDGAPARSCVTPISSLGNKHVKTIESLASDAAYHPVQQAWLERDVAQCGYCQSGQIMQAASLLLSNPSPTDAEIITSMNGNLCRCMAYGRIKQAIKIAAASEVGDE